MITYQSGDLFTAPQGSILLHACNCKGRWGSGIAATFAKRFPQQYGEYQTLCSEKGSSLLGTVHLLTANRFTIACLFTSRNYGAFIDSEEKILESTESGLTHC